MHTHGLHQVERQLAVFGCDIALGLRSGQRNSDERNWRDRRGNMEEFHEMSSSPTPKRREGRRDITKK
jgi:hypothetical protein